MHIARIIICMKSNDLLRTEADLMSKQARALGLTQSIIAEHLDASQSQVSRILSGTSKRRSKLFDAVYNYVFSAGKHPPPESSPLSKELNDALAAVWDGTPEHGRALALVIRSLGVLHRDHASMPNGHTVQEAD